MRFATTERYQCGLASTYWTFGYAIDWIAFRNLDRLRGDVYGDLEESDRSKLAAAAEGLRHALLDGGLAAIGIKPSGATDTVPADEWLTRHVHSIENEDLQSPYRLFVVKRAEVQRFWPEGRQLLHPPMKRGRRKGVGGYAKQDASVIARMEALLNEGAATSPYGAAMMVVADAAGAGTDESKVKRLVDRYRAVFPNR